MRVTGHDFVPRDLVGGHVVVDLVNTVTARNAEPIDWLDGYPRLLEWAGLTGAFDRRALASLALMADADPRGAASALRHVKGLREALVAVLTTMIGHDDLPAEELARLERSWKDAVEHSRIRVVEGRAELEVDAAVSGLDHLTHCLALSSMELLRELPIDRTRVCQGTRCGWVFIDTSKGGRRRWCDMATCGNATKSRRHYERVRGRARGARPLTARSRATGS
jgi:predicted RNA-binding Zn ribbon-like protein